MVGRPGPEVHSGPTPLAPDRVTAEGVTAAGVAAEHEFVTLDGQRYACIRDVDRLAPFLMSIAGDSDAWLFVGSNSPFTAGRIDPDGAMFPYETVDKLLRHADGSGALSAFRVRRGGSGPVLWEPWRSDAQDL